MTEVALLTGSSGLIGSEVAAFFHERGFAVHGVDNNQREIFFGPQGSTRWNQERLMRTLPRFTHHELDIRDRSGILRLVEQLKPTLIIHTAAQPSHDLSNCASIMSRTKSSSWTTAVPTAPGTS
jgi:CDP-paratose 2-epimerase